MSYTRSNRKSIQISFFINPNVLSSVKQQILFLLNRVLFPFTLSIKRSLENGICLFIGEFLTQVLEEHTKGPSPCIDFYKLPPIELDDDCICEEKEDPVYCKYADSKEFIKKLTNFLYINYPNFKGNFEYLVRREMNFKYLTFIFCSNKDSKSLNK